MIELVSDEVVCISSSESTGSCLAGADSLEGTLLQACKSLIQIPVAVE